MQLDQKQEYIAKSLDQIALDLLPPSLMSHFHKFFKRKKLPRGVYLYGSVGSGKTMLMQRFFDNLRVKGQILHYQDFMLKLHTRLHSIQNIAKDQIINEIVESVAKTYRVLCIDEFEIKDITDAMLIMHLFKRLIHRKVFLFITTNTTPDNLYQDGIQRESFLPFIGMVKKDFTVLNLDAEQDYRFMNVSAIENRIFYPNNTSNKAKVEEIKRRLCKEDEITPAKIEVFGREVHFARAHQNILFTDFTELCQQNFSYADYVNICQNYKIIVLENVPEIHENETDLIIRFINFIDNAYFYRILLFISLDKKPEEIYKSGRRINEFKRTISRLNEMNSESYLK